MNVIQRDADHSENSYNILFWDQLGGILFNNISNALFALFHYETREVVFIFHNIFDLDNQGVI